MREYVPGDDLRRIVWRASARTGKIMVREAEQGITDHITIILDTDRGSHSRDGEGLSESFETGVRAAASLGVRHLREGYEVKVETNGGPLDPPPARRRRQQLLHARRARPARARPRAARRGDHAAARRRRSATPTTSSSRPRLGADEAAQLKLLLNTGVSVLVVALLWDEENADTMGVAAVARLPGRRRAPGPGPRDRALQRHRRGEPHLMSDRSTCSTSRALEPTAASASTTRPATSTTTSTPRRPTPRPSSADDDESPAVRLALAVAFPVVAAAVMVGGVFTGVEPRIYAARRRPARRRPRRCVVAPASAAPLVANVADHRRAVRHRPAHGRCPTGLEQRRRASASLAPRGGAVAATCCARPCRSAPGWQAIVGWLMGIVGFAAAWLATVVAQARRSRCSCRCRSPPSPASACPRRRRSRSGIAVLVLFAIGLGLLSSAQPVGEEDERPPLAYEVRKALRGAAAHRRHHRRAVFLAADRLPVPRPADRPGRGAAEAEDGAALRGRGPRAVRGRVDGAISGPWRIGSLDVYDGTDWRLPPFDENELDDVPDDGVVDQELSTAGREGRRSRSPASAARCCPALPNTVGIVRRGPELAYDARTGNIRVAQGQVQAGLRVHGRRRRACRRSTTCAASTRDDRPTTSSRSPRSADRRPRCRRCSTRPTPTFDNQWDHFDFLRTYVLDERHRHRRRRAGERHARAGAGRSSATARRRRRSRSSPLRRCSPAGSASRRASATASTAASVVERHARRSGRSTARRSSRSTSRATSGSRSSARRRRPSRRSAATRRSSSSTRTSCRATTSAVQLFLPVLVPPPSTLGDADAARRCSSASPSRSCSVAAIYVADPALRKASSAAGAAPRRERPGRAPASRWRTPSGATSPPTSASGTRPTRRSCSSTGSSTTPSTPSWRGSSTRAAVGRPAETTPHRRAGGRRRGAVARAAPPALGRRSPRRCASSPPCPASRCATRTRPRPISHAARRGPRGARSVESPTTPDQSRPDRATELTVTWSMPEPSTRSRRARARRRSPRLRACHLGRPVCASTPCRPTSSSASTEPETTSRRHRRRAAAAERDAALVRRAHGPFREPTCPTASTTSDFSLDPRRSPASARPRRSARRPDDRRARERRRQPPRRASTGSRQRDGTKTIDAARVRRPSRRGSSGSTTRIVRASSAPSETLWTFETVEPLAGRRSGHDAGR